MKKPLVPDDKPIELFATSRHFAAWLKRNHASAAGVWLRMVKKSSELKSITYAEALDAALCYGWIDGQSRSCDADTYLQKFTPRGRRSIWSKINREHVRRLTEEGRMQSAGQAEVDRARQDGRWDAAYDSARTAVPSPELLAALNENAAAKAFFSTLKGQNRYAILFRIHTAKKPETRAKRIAQFVDMLARGETIHPQPNSKKSKSPD